MSPVRPDGLDFDPETDVEPAPEPDNEPVDGHRGPLDDDEDGRWLERDDPRRIEAERRRGRPFDQDEGDEMDIGR
jgi:hypothetical protein